MQGYGSRFLATNSRRVNDMELKEVTYSDIIEDYLATFKENMSVRDVVYKVVKDNLMNKKYPLLIL